MSDSQPSTPPSPKTAGQRLEAARAAKAARKAAERGRNAELTEDRALEQVAVARDWLQDNIKMVLAVGGIMIGLAAIVAGWSTFATGQNQSAGTALWDALQKEDGRAEAFTGVIDGHADTAAASWAQLGKAKALREAGNTADAKTAYEAVIKSGGGETIAWLALEGLAYTYEADGDIDGAVTQLERMAALGPSVSPIARYHQGRLLLGQGKNEEAKKSLSDALTELNKEGQGYLPHTRSQVEAKLAILDPGRPRTPSFDQAQLQQLLQQQQQAAP